MWIRTRSSDEYLKILASATRFELETTKTGEESEEPDVIDIAKLKKGIDE